MSVERENAVINNTIILRNNFRFSQTNDLFTPYAISKVEILDSDGVTVIETITGANIINDSVGKYHVMAAAIVTAKTIYDKWYFTPASGATEITKTNTCIVWETAATAGTPEIATDAASMLAAVNLAIATRMNGGAVQSYSIGGRNLQYMPLQDLMKLRDQLRAEINVSSGYGRNHAKFVNTD